MTCEDCLYYNFCANQYGDTDYFDDEDVVTDVEKYCNQAEDKTKYIKLPCKVGDTVYYPCGSEIYEKNVVCFMIKSQEPVVFFNTELNESCEIKDFGKVVFIKREEAEQALKEVKEND